jgi:hypothetical protein
MLMDDVLNSEELVNEGGESENESDDDEFSREGAPTPNLQLKKGGLDGYAIGLS